MQYRVGDTLPASQETMLALPLATKVKYSYADTYYEDELPILLYVYYDISRRRNRLRVIGGEKTFSGDIGGGTITIVELPPEDGPSANYDLVLKALKMYADANNWRPGGPLDPTTPQFAGTAIAQQALGLLNKE